MIPSFQNDLVQFNFLLVLEFLVTEAFGGVSIFVFSATAVTFRGAKPLKEVLGPPGSAKRRWLSLGLTLSTRMV